MRREVQVVYKRRRRPIFDVQRTRVVKMKKRDAIKMIDERCTKVLLDPVEMLNWMWLRTIISCLSDEAWEACVEDATRILAR